MLVRLIILLTYTLLKWTYKCSFKCRCPDVAWSVPGIAGNRQAAYDILLVFYCNYVSILCRFGDSESGSRQCPIHSATPDTTKQSRLCRVWRGAVNWTIATNVFRFQFFLSATVLSCRESNWDRWSGRDTDKTVVSCLAWRCEWAVRPSNEPLLGSWRWCTVCRPKRSSDTRLSVASRSPSESGSGCSTAPCPTASTPTEGSLA